MASVANDRDEGGTRKRSRRSGWDVDEPVKVAKQIHEPKNSMENSHAPVVQSTRSNPIIIPSVSSISPTISTPTSSMAAITAQILAQQVLAKSGLSNIAPKLENRIYVGSLHYSLREPEVIALFSAFGPVVKCDMSFDNALGRSKGFCFVEFQDSATANAAMAMDGFELAGRKIKVGRPSHAQMMPSNNLPTFAAPNLPALMSLPQNSHMVNASSSVSQPQAHTTPTIAISNSQSIGVNSAAPTSYHTPFLLIRNIRTSIGLPEIEELFALHGKVKSTKRLPSTQLDPSLYFDVLLEYEESGNVSARAAETMNGYMLSKSQLIVEAIPLSRAVELMIQKVESTTAQNAKTVILEEMILPEDLADPELKEEISEEAGKYGSIEKLDISLSASGHQAIVEIIYSDAIQALRACKALNGRGFAGRKIRATLRNQ